MPTHQNPLSTHGRRPLLEHQRTAVERIAAVLAGHDRAKYIAACGSGKTLVGLHSAARLNARDIVVFLPSLALVRQTLIEYTGERLVEGHAILCVCSDSGVAAGLDASVVTEEDLGLPITTDALSIRRFFAKHSQRPRLVFCTYQSARLLADGLPKGFQFDLGVFDEAHKTAGNEGKAFALALKDAHIPIRKRLFLTATPRHCRLRKANEDEPVTVYSMDSEADYGPMADQLSFSDAIQRGLISDYKAIITYVTSEDLDRRYLRRGSKLIADGREIDLTRAVHLIAMQKAIAEFGIKKVFTFHGTVEDARRFTQGTDQSFQEYLPGFEALHINGSMPVRERNGVMGLFGAADKAVLSNARCLTEGVDVPEADMVAFLCPKRSLIDIVQAVGRALRTHPGKRFGYVLLPVFVDRQKDESLEEACRRTRYDFAWEVIQAMKTVDAELSADIAAASVKLGQGGNAGAVEFSKKIRIVGTMADLEVVKRGTAVVYVEAVGEPFDVWFGRLLAYKEKYGGCRVPRGFLVDGKDLGGWLERARSGRVLLTVEQCERLTAIGFDWFSKKTSWERNFNALVDFQKVHGHCRVPRGYLVGGVDIYGWAADQRVKRKRNCLTRNKINRLDAIGFDWNPRNTPEKYFKFHAQRAREIGH